MRRFISICASFDLPLLILLVFIGCLFIPACGGEVDTADDQSAIAVSCAVTRVRYPTTAEEFARLYQGRGFGAAGNHLGRDIDLPEGTAISPIACGTIRVYRPASGYGTLAVVVEHRLVSPLLVRNGLGQMVEVQSFLSIYGHQRASAQRNGSGPTGLHVGDTVRPDQTISYVQNDALNGDGAEHLHLGIRLQSLADAEHSDINWFRGYDATPSQRRWFADPADFLPRLLAAYPDPASGGESSPTEAPVADGLQYDFRVVPSSGWSAVEPFRIRDQWWSPVTCQNTGTSAMEPLSDGWHRCDLGAALSPFVGSFSSATHPTWGELGTVGNAPAHCTATPGVEWRITDLPSGRVRYSGASAGLPCVSVGPQDRHALP